MKLLLTTIVLGFSFIAFAEDYIPDENHTPPQNVEKQEEESRERDEKHMDVRKPDSDPRFEKFHEKMPEDREYDYVP